MCGPVLAELAAGVPAPERARLVERLGALAWVDLDRLGWWRVAELAGRLRDLGARVPLVDVWIAVTAVSADAVLWTRDRDFEPVRGVLGRLRLYEPA